MFTGIIEAIGSVEQMESRGGDMRVRINTGKLPMENTHLGDSIAVNGVCLTAIDLGGQYFSADVSSESLSLTTLGELLPGSPVNLERALTLETRLGGHLVSGHVDGLGSIISRDNAARSVHFVVEAPAGLARYISRKGSICVDGVSLTVNEISGNRFELNIVPHTLSETIMSTYEPGKQVNLEVDLVARYLERLLLGDEAAQSNGISREQLLKAGFLQS